METPYTDAIRVEHLTKTYGALRAVDDVSFAVRPGEVFGLLGPNGAGKSTTTELIAGLHRPDSGSIRVLGVDVLREPARVKQRIGVQLQTTALFPALTVRELLALFASFFERSLPVETLISLVNLHEKAHTRSKHLSGGQRQRLALALALVNDPAVVFLDEPTASLDPQSRHALWAVIDNLKRRGTTVLLTTHAMDEAERLCDRVAIVDGGRLLALDAPRALIQAHTRRVALTFATNALLARDQLAALPEVESLQVHNGTTTLYSRSAARTTQALMALAEARQTELANFSTRTPTLEDVFLSLTGRRIRQ